MSTDLQKLVTFGGDADDVKEIARLSEFNKSIREYEDFRDLLLRLSTCSRSTRQAIRREIYDTIDQRVKNAIAAASAASPAPAAVDGGAQELAAAVETLLADMGRRAKARGDVDDDGTVILDAGAGVVSRVHAAIRALKGAKGEKA